MIIPILPSQSSWRLHAIAIALKLPDIDFRLPGALQECQTFSIGAAAQDHKCGNRTNSGFAGVHQAVARF